jgi:hypothetical protein
MKFSEMFRPKRKPVWSMSIRDVQLGGGSFADSFDGALLKRNLPK